MGMSFREYYVNGNRFQNYSRKIHGDGNGNDRVGMGGIGNTGNKNHSRTSKNLQ